MVVGFEVVSSDVVNREVGAVRFAPPCTAFSVTLDDDQTVYAFVWASARGPLHKKDLAPIEGFAQSVLWGTTYLLTVGKDSTLTAWDVATKLISTNKIGSEILFFPVRRAYTFLMVIPGLVDDHPFTVTARWVRDTLDDDDAIIEELGEIHSSSELSVLRGEDLDDLASVRATLRRCSLLMPWARGYLDALAAADAAADSSDSSSDSTS